MPSFTDRRLERSQIVPVSRTKLCFFIKRRAATVAGWHTSSRLVFFLFEYCVRRAYQRKKIFRRLEDSFIPPGDHDTMLCGGALRGLPEIDPSNNHREEKVSRPRTPSLFPGCVGPSIQTRLPGGLPTAGHRLVGQTLTR